MPAPAPFHAPRLASGFRKNKAKTAVASENRRARNSSGEMPPRANFTSRNVAPQTSVLKTRASSAAFRRLTWLTCSPGSTAIPITHQHQQGEEDPLQAQVAALGPVPFLR